MDLSCLEIEVACADALLDVEGEPAGQSERGSELEERGGVAIDPDCVRLPRKTNQVQGFGGSIRELLSCGAVDDGGRTTAFEEVDDEVGLRVNHEGIVALDSRIHFRRQQGEVLALQHSQPERRTYQPDADLQLQSLPHVVVLQGGQTQSHDILGGFSSKIHAALPRLSSDHQLRQSILQIVVARKQYLLSTVSQVPFQTGLALPTHHQVAAFAGVQSHPAVIILRQINFARFELE